MPGGRGERHVIQARSQTPHRIAGTASLKDGVWTVRAQSADLVGNTNERLLTGQDDSLRLREAEVQRIRPVRGERQGSEPAARNAGESRRELAGFGSPRRWSPFGGPDDRIAIRRITANASLQERRTRRTNIAVHAEFETAWLAVLGSCFLRRFERTEFIRQSAWHRLRGQRNGYCGFQAAQNRAGSPDRLCPFQDWIASRHGERRGPTEPRPSCPSGSTYPGRWPVRLIG
jgi:hypothetical protein